MSITTIVIILLAVISYILFVYYVYMENKTGSKILLREWVVGLTPCLFALIWFIAVLAWLIDEIRED